MVKMNTTASPLQLIHTELFEPVVIGEEKLEKKLVHSTTSLKFKRQIKQFEKLQSSLARLQLSQKLSHAYDTEDKPTFFFGPFARAQLVDPIEGDGHF